MEFTAELQLHGKTATGITVPPEVIEALGAGKRVPVIVSLGTYSYRTTVAPYGGVFLIPVSAEHRQAAGVTAGEFVRVGLEVDAAPRTVDVPADLKKALAASKSAKIFFDSLAVSHQREYVRWVEEAKKPETRNARITKCVGLLESGMKTR